jgi:hypothetical protein
MMQVCHCVYGHLGEIVIYLVQCYVVSCLLFTDRLVADTSSRVQAYIHQHAWLLYSSLALSVASILYSRHNDAVDCDYIQLATRIYESSIQLAIRHFMQLPKHQGLISGFVILFCLPSYC